MAAQRPQVRLDGRERQMLDELLNSLRRDGLATTASDVLRRCLREAYNKRQRSSRKPQVPPIPGDTGGELRRGRPRSNPKPGQYRHTVNY